jgi:hypothetical protein
MLKCKVFKCTPVLLVWEELLLHINQAIQQPSKNILTMRFKFGNPFSMFRSSERIGFNFGVIKEVNI